MRGLHLIVFLAALPFLAAIGHDAVLYMMHPERGFMLSALGFLWTEYSPEGYKWAVRSLDRDQWALVNKALTWKAVYAGAAFAGAVYALLFVLAAVGRLFSGARRPRHTPTHHRGESFQYKRK